MRGKFMYKFGSFLENIATVFFFITLALSFLIYLDGRSYSQLSSSDQSLIGIAVLICIVCAVLGWALKNAAQAEPPKDGAE